MRLDFFLWLAGTKLGEAFQWIFGSRTGLRLALLAALMFLAVELYMFLFVLGQFMDRDSAEHLSMVHALERGEIPYRDFPQNHPLLFHLLLLQLKRLFGATDFSDVYLLTKAFIGLHIIACFALFVCVLRNLCKREFGDARSGLVFIAVAPVLGIWAGWGGFWVIRPDWVAYFYAYLAAVSHLLMMRKIIQGGSPAGWLILGAAGCGLGAAILPKVIYVIVPYMMTLCLAALGSPGYWLEKLSGKLTRMFLINVVFAALSLLFFVGFVAYELRATRANAMDYIHSNYSMNAETFKFFTHRTGNPFVELRNILDLPMVMVYVLAMSCFPLLLMLHDRKKYLFKYAVLFVGLTVLFNASFPIYSNGVVWNYYFIPSAMAIALYITVVVICLLHCMAPVLQAADRSRQRLDLRQGLAAFQLALAFIILLSMAVSSALGTGRLAGGAVLRKIAESEKTVFVTEKYMPPELRYWAFEWNEKPVSAPVWGYFVQFSDIYGFWRKMHGLGVGPDPVTHWRTEYERSPPDAITVESLKALKKHARRIKDMQHIDIGRLLDRVREDYSCISRGRPFLMRNDLAQAYLQKGGWRLCGHPA